MRSIPFLLLAAAVPGCIVVAEPYPAPPRPAPDPVGYYVDDTCRVLWIEYYGCTDADIDRCAALGWTEDEIGVALYLSYHAHCDVDRVISLRRARLSWWDVTLRLDLSPEIFHVEVRGDVPAPYGRAYGYFHKRDPKYVFVDADVVNLVHLRVATHYYRLDPVVVMRQREKGVGFPTMVKEHHGKSIGQDVRGKPVKQPPPAPRGKGKPEDDKGRGKGKKD